MRTAYSRKRILGAVLVDVAMIILSFLAAYFVRFLWVLPTDRGVPGILAYSHVLFVIVPVFLWFFREARLYEPTRHVRRIEEIFLVIKSVTYAVIVLTAATFFYRDYTYSRLGLLILWFFACVLISAGRYGVIQWEYVRRRQKKDITEVLIIGAGQNAHELIRWAQNNPHYGLEIVGVLTRDPANIGKHLEDVSIVGLTSDWEAWIDKLQPGRVVLLDPDFSRETVTELVVTCEDRMIEFKIGADTHGLIAQNVGVEYISNIPLLGFKPLPLDDLWNRFVKRSFDLVLAAAAGLVFLPFGTGIAALIKITDRGPVFYRQERIGRDGRTFGLLKFRTMKVDAEKETGPVWAKKNDARRTRLGEFLRRTNLDEVPQLWNIIRGDMSLVGPRPERPHFVNQFREVVPRYMARHKIKSGLTGWAQVHGLRGDTSIHDRVKYDLYYMENWSLLLDIEIMVMTLFAFKNAY
jgi:exopolysaccharide biosynthesis polyprenyl glycosylphosphotransferase